MNIYADSLRVLDRDIEAILRDGYVRSFPWEAAREIWKRIWND